MILDFKRMVDESLAGCYVHDEEGRLCYVNDIVTTFTGYSKDELIGKSIFDLFYEEDLQRYAELMNSVLSGKKAFYEVRYRTKDGKIRWVWGFCKPFEAEGKKYVLGNCIDVTRLKEAEERLKESELFFKTLIDESLAPVYIVSDRFIYVNRAVEEVSGYSRDELLSMDPLQLVHPDDREMVGKRLRERLLGLRETETYSFRIVTKDRKIKWVTVKPTRIIYKGSPAVVATALDITEIQELAESLRKKEEYLRLVNRILRHDIANALTSIIFALEEFQDNEIAKKALLKADYIVRLIEISRELESGVNELRPIRLDEIAREIAESFGVSFECEEVSVMANESLRIVVQNLVDNAVRHGKNDVRLEVKKSESRGILRVSDRGQGIPDEIKEKIFKEGFTTNRMGLFIVKKLVDLLGGKIEVYDNFPSGTVFEVSLPLAP
uniref:histidine kinase n=1 Tax=Archaeoglobus fulgidus TaxID=2234 RepID=A0A7J2TKN6_ARCFL